MIEARMTELNYNEILMYLGHRGQDVTPRVEEQIHRCVSLVRQCAAPRLVYSRMPVEQGGIAGFPMEGEDIRRLLAPCREAVLLAVTLGAQVEQELMRCEVTDMADAVIMDSCASVAAENVCDCFEEDMREEVRAEHRYLTSRFSPGYGDLPINTQQKMCGVLNTARRIGLTVTENYIMVPRKSVTAVMGISDEPQELRSRGCEACSMFLTCAYRKKGMVCHE
ncbi:MAG: vitamin B12 dependent methionine synthase, activation domain protein [Clostridiales bacterium]|nr:vitamin B12 dependent methionine synthase, activation domain protein [Clostridiales bacterium]